MSASPFDNPLTAPLFGDDEIADLWSAPRQLDHMLAFERALTAAFLAVGRISAEDAAAANRALADFRPDIADLAPGIARDGVVVPALIRAIRDTTDAKAAIHTGSTSQDVTDAALALTLKALIPALEGRATKLLADLSKLEAMAEGRTMMGRTRMQAALPIDAAHRVREWRAPIEAAVAGLSDLAPKLIRVQVGGPVGDRSTLGPEADRIADHVADALGLTRADTAWHTDRTAIVQFGQALALISGTLGKLGADVALMAQQGVDDIALEGGGTSSAMAHKNNPILAELLVTLAAYNAAQSTALTGTLVHEQERSGSAWALEWLVLPPMTVAAGRGLQAATDLIGSVRSIGHQGHAAS